MHMYTILQHPSLVMLIAELKALSPKTLLCQLLHEIIKHDASRSLDNR